MTNPIKIIYQAAKIVFSQRNYQIWFFILTALLIWAYIFIPVWLTPGNDLIFQLSLWQALDYLLIIAFSVLVSLLILMQAFLISRFKKGQIKGIFQAGTGTFSGLFAGLLATAVCSSCLAALLGFLSAGSLFFIFQNRLPIAILAGALVIAGIYLAAYRIKENCKDCKA